MRTFLGVAILWILLAADSSFAQDFVAKVTLDDPVQGLRFKPQVKVKKTKKGIPFVDLLGVLQTPGWAIAYKKKILVRAGATERRFRIKTRVKGKSTLLRLYVRSPEGRNQEVRVTIDFDEFDVVMAEQPKTETDTSNSDSPLQRRGGRKKFFITPALGFTSSNYKEEVAPNTDFSMSAISFKIAARYALNPKWDLAGNAYLTTFALSKSIEEASVRYLGLNMRVGYRFNKYFSLHFGYFFSTMLVTVTGSTPEFGFTNVTGPQLFPIFFWNRFYLYGKYSPISSQFKLLALSSNREIAAGFGYNLPQKNGRAWTFGFDYNHIKLNISDVPLTSSSMTVGVGYQL